VADIFLIGFYRGNSLKAMQFKYNVFTFYDFLNLVDNFYCKTFTVLPIMYPF
jgi:hypothetical protein